MSPPQKQNVHLICNAHLDPVWLWQWHEGAAEAISTFRVAADLCEKNNAFIFNHNEAILYKWIQEYEPSLFERIRKLVKASKWHIMGGWYLQPDCNMPSGESFVRQILKGKSYFRKEFGVEPSTAINFDPFGHTRGLVQILTKSGYDSYIFGRPQKKWLELPADTFLWIGYDGSEIKATRFSGWYNTPLGKAAETIKSRIEQNSDQDVLAILWGVGNHGGGPSKADLRQVNQLIKNTREVNIVHSTPEQYFKDLSRTENKLPEFTGDLNPWGVGCYTSIVRIKQKHRLLENELYMTEKMASAAVSAGLMKYPGSELEEALTDLMFSEFHDILPGSSIAPVEEDAIRTLDHGLDIISKHKTRAFFALASGQPKAKDGEIPILVYNPHPFKISAMVACEFNLADFNTSGTFTQAVAYRNGKALPSQVEKEYSSLPIDWRKHMVFAAELEPGQMNRFDCRLNVIKAKPTPRLKARNDKIVFKTNSYQVIINTRTGLVDRYRIKGIDYIAKNAFLPLAMADDEDPWGQNVRNFRKIAGKFKLMNRHAAAKFAGLRKAGLEPVRVIEDGEVRTVVEVLMQYDQSFICQRYKLSKISTEIELELDVYWNQKNQMLKLSVPTVDNNSRYIGQAAYGVADLPGNGDEAVAQKWVASISPGTNRALTCINDGTYGSDFKNGEIRLTLLRSPVYSGHSVGENEIPVQDRYIQRIDQGQRKFTFWFNGGNIKQRLERIDREALTKNEKPFALSFFPSGQGKIPKPFAVLSDDVIQITTIKKAHNNDDLIVRVFEPTGKARLSLLSLPQLGKKIKVSLSPFEIKTLRINSKRRQCFETDLLERTIPNILNR